MKRSEVVADVSWALMELIEGDYAFEDVASALVELVEDLGMKPPEIKATFLLTKEDGTKQPSFSMVNRWEPEND